MKRSGMESDKAERPTLRNSPERIHATAAPRKTSGTSTSTLTATGCSEAHPPAKTTLCHRPNETPSPAATTRCPPATTYSPDSQNKARPAATIYSRQPPRHAAPTVIKLCLQTATKHSRQPQRHTRQPERCAARRPPHPPPHFFSAIPVRGHRPQARIRIPASAPSDLSPQFEPPAQQKPPDTRAPQQRTHSRKAPARKRKRRG